MSPDVKLNVTLGVFGAIVLGLLQERVGPEVVMLIGMLILVSCGIVTLDSALAGFADKGVIMIGALYVVGAGLQNTGAIETISRWMLGKPTAKTGLMRLFAPVAGLSAFMNNTPLVAFFMPVFVQLAKRLRISPSRFLIPLSYAAILGGVCTLVGTSTNLVTDSIMGKNGLPRMSLFELSTVGVPIAIVGLIYLCFVGRYLLPDRVDLLEHIETHRREYTVEMLVTSNCALIGQTIRQAGLRDLPGLYLYRIERGTEAITPVGPQDKLNLGDVLCFSGIASTVVDLQKIRGLSPVDHLHSTSSTVSKDLSGIVSLDSFEGLPPIPPPVPAERIGRQLCEVVISSTSPLQGKTIREANFRTHYNASILAVHRSGEKLNEKIGKISLLAGDTLLIDADDDFIRRWRHSPDFILVSGVEDSAPVAHERAWIALLVFGAVLFGMSTPFVEPAVVALVGAVVMIVTGCVRGGEAHQSIQIQVVVLIGAALGIGEALKSSGAAAYLATSILSTIGSSNPVVILAVIYMLTLILSEFLSNNATAAMMGSLAIATGTALNVSPRPFLIAVTVAASCAFASPIGYQTNLMVLNPGGYKFLDYVKVGLPLNLLCAIVAILIIPWAWSF